jgi:APA family basic amino acid/polyamine antiporter
MIDAKTDSTPTLKRGLTLLDATMIVIGSMIGSGIFITSAESARLVGSPGWLLAAWALAGVMTITGALCCAELAAMMPHAGGQYVFLGRAYSPAVGFLFGWSLFSLFKPARSRPWPLRLRISPVCSQTRFRPHTI